MTPRPADRGLDVAVDPGATLGEGPVWDHDAGVLMWVDIPAGVIHRFDPAASRDESHDTSLEPSALIPHDNGGWALVAGQSLYSYTWGEQPQHLLEVCPGPREIRLNDAACDALGRLWVGSYHVDRVEGRASWYVVDGERPDPLFTGGTLSNGVASDPTGEAMYVVDSRARAVDRVGVDLGDGSLGEREPWLALPDVDGVPDGLAVDAEGAVWIAFYFGGQVRRYSAQGALLRTVQLPVRRVTSVAFGGSRLTDLYITTARGDSDDEIAEEPLGGAVFVLADAGEGARPNRWNPRTAGIGVSRS